MKIKKTKKLLHRLPILKPALTISLIIVALTAALIYANSKRPQIALVQEPNPACTFNFSIKKPSPPPSANPSVAPSPSPSPITSPKPSLCVITTIPADHTSVCWKSPQKATLKVHVDSLPNNPPYYLVSDWQLVAPTVGPNHIQTLTQEIKVGETYTLTADWPGIPLGSRDTFDVMISYNVKEGDRYNGRLIGGACAKGFNYYWTPWVNCP